MNPIAARSGSPFFSIVMPTRNRAHLLRHSLRSALNQTFDDYEIVVSDNYSDDETPQVVRGLDHPRLRYVRTTEAMSMPDHWEFALDHARGQFVGYLCDDDAFTAPALARAAEALQKHAAKLIVLGWAKYSGSTSFEAPIRNSVLMPVKPAGLSWKMSQETLPQMTKCRLSLDLPLMLNSFCQREVLEQVRREAGKLFILAPDYSFSLMIQTAVPTWLHLDEPLRLQGEFAESIGTTQLRNRGQAAQVFLKEFGNQSFFGRSPMDLYLMSNVLANTFQLCKNRLKGLAGFDIDWVSYFEGCWIDMATLADYDVEVRDDREVFWRVLGEQSSDIQTKVKDKINSPEMQARLRQGWRHPSWQLRVRWNFWRNKSWQYYRGSKYGFSNIFEAAQLVTKLNGKRPRTGALEPAG